MIVEKHFGSYGAMKGTYILKSIIIYYTCIIEQINVKFIDLHLYK